MYEGRGNTPEGLEDALKRLSEVNLKIKVTKCRFFSDKVKFLDFTITEEGMRMDEGRIGSLKKCLFQKKKILGACYYFWLFVKGFPEIADPLYELLRKDSKFNRTDKQSKAVVTLKNKLCLSPILKYLEELLIYTGS